LLLTGLLHVQLYALHYNAVQLICSGRQATSECTAGQNEQVAAVITSHTTSAFSAAQLLVSATDRACKAAKHAAIIAWWTTLAPAVEAPLGTLVRHYIA
jgi:hypothetical protein